MNILISEIAVIRGGDDISDARNDERRAKEQYLRSGGGYNTRRKLLHLLCD